MMLHQLVVENIALIQHLNLEFETGLTVLTGETGAGKSIIIDALSLVLGTRADTTLIRSGTERAMVQASFQLDPLHPALLWLREKSLDNPWISPNKKNNSNPEEALFLRRVLSTNGRSRAFINETQVPLATLSELGVMLVEIHSQQDHQTLLDSNTHLTILDNFANHLPLVQAVKTHFDQWRKIALEQKNLLKRQADAIDRRAFLTFQLQELQAIDLKTGELTELEQHHSRLTHVTQLAKATQDALDLLLENNLSASTLTGRAAGALESITGLDPSLEPIAITIRSLQYELDDAGARVRHYLNGLEIDPAQLDALGDRIDLIRRMARKHRREADQLPELEQQWQLEIDQIDSAEEQEKYLDRAFTAARESYMQSAQRLSQSRQETALRLNQAVEGQLRDLHMANTRFSATLLPRNSEPRPSGLEDVVFQVSTNPGEPLKPLQAIASGGELARITLALKTTLAHSLPVQTLIFDEVDTGVGGRVAASIGAKMAHISQKRQVLSVTHLPQVASWGNHHLKVEKFSHEETTTVTITPLDPAMRIEELARMLAGDTITTPARQHAQELLDACLEKRGPEKITAPTNPTKRKLANHEQQQNPA